MDHLSIVKADRRQQVRRPCNLRLSPKIYVKDISVSGLRIESINNYGVRDKIPLEFKDENKAVSVLNGTIVRSRSLPNSNKREYGVLFDSLSKQQTRLLSELAGKVVTDDKDFKTVKSGLYRLPRYGKEFLAGLDSKAMVVQNGVHVSGELSDFSMYGCRVSFNAPLKCAAGETIRTLTLLLHGERIYRGKAEVRYVNVAGEGRYDYGLRFLSNGLNTDRIIALRDCARSEIELQKIFQGLNDIGGVSPEFKVAVGDLRYLLSSLKKHLKNGHHAETTHQTVHVDIENNRLASIEAKFSKKVHDILTDIESLVRNLDQPLLTTYRTYYRENLVEYLEAAEVMRRSFYKPLGYAGDYDTMNIIYDRPRGGANLWERVMNSFLCSAPPAQAVRNRSSFLYRKIEEVVQTNTKKKHGLNIMSVACGPCKEIQLFVGKKYYDIPRMSFYLLDQEPKALEYASSVLHESNFRRKHPVQFHFLNKSVKDLLIDPEVAAKCPPQDLIYSAGLFDYLSEDIAKSLIAVLFSRLKPGGTLVIGNFSPFNPSRCLQEFGLDWYLIYRDEQTIRELVPQDLDADQIFIEKEETGVNLFLNVVKSRSA